MLTNACITLLQPREHQPQPNGIPLLSQSGIALPHSRLKDVSPLTSLWVN